MFAEQLVIPSTGETHQEFNDVRAGIWDFVRPANAVTAILADDLTGAYWRLQRPRRCETAEIRRRRDSARGRLHFEKVSEIEVLKSRFIRDFAALCSLTQAPTNPPALVVALEETRIELERKSMGLEFLISLIESIQKTINDKGYLSPSDETLLVNVCGVADTCAKTCLIFNRIGKAEMEKLKKDQSTHKKSFELNRQLISMTLTSKLKKMKVTERAIEKNESAEEDAYLATLVMPPVERAEQILRAEAALSRRFFKH